MSDIVTSIVEQLAGLQTLHLVWAGLGVLTVALLLMLVTRWGESKPVGKCLLLSLVGHCLLGVYATTVIVAQEMLAETEEPAFEIERVEIVDPTERGEAVSTPTAVWDRFVHRGPIETVPIQTPRPDVPEAPSIERDAQPSEFPEEQPKAEVPLRAAELPRPGQLVHSSARATGVTADPVEIGEAPAPQRQEPGETPLPGMRETRLRPAAPEAQPTRRRSAPEAPVETPFSDPLLRHPRRRQALADGPTAARIDTVDIPSRRGGASEPLPLPQDLSDGPAQARTAPAAMRPAVPASPSLRRRPGPRGLAGPTLVRRAPAPAGALSGGQADTPSSFPETGSSDRLKPTPVRPQAADTSPSSVPFRNRAKVPSAYRLRTAPNRRELAVQRGGSEESERAVEDALKWLASHQSADGRWDADGFSANCPANDRCDGFAGQGKEIDGQDRSSAGRTADTGMTALALLAFLGAGHTHEEGPYADAVGRGLVWLLGRQAGDGNLAGDADTFAFMYCHGMATIALGEAYGMTGDSRLIEPLQRAVQFIVGMQDAQTGGWRYRRSRQGDTSVLGWQVMALKSAERAGIDVPAETWEQAQQFLRSVGSGPYGGLASYRPGEAVKVSMTAEALACHQLLGRPRNHPASEEAVQYVLRSRPASSSYNLYFWYYATLSLYHHGGTAWQSWNDAMRDTVVRLQNKRGHARGSWDPTSHWSPHGGRVYSTAMAALCLEVYYRYLPLYSHLQVPVTSNDAGRGTAQRPEPSPAGRK